MPAEPGHETHGDRDQEETALVWEQRPRLSEAGTGGDSARGSPQSGVGWGRGSEFLIPSQQAGPPHPLPPHLRVDSSGSSNPEAQLELGPSETHQPRMGQRGTGVPFPLERSRAPPNPVRSTREVWA